MNLIATRSKVIAVEPMTVWTVITDIENAGNHISGIKKIEVLQPGAGDSIVGLKWRETREWMGRDAVEVMWVTDAEKPTYYETRAESHGCIYKSRFELSAVPTGTELSMSFRCQPLSFGAKLMWFATGWMAKKSLVNVIDKDLEDIKQAAEKV